MYLRNLQNHIHHLTNPHSNKNEPLSIELDMSRMIGSTKTLSKAPNMIGYAVDATGAVETLKQMLQVNMKGQEAIWVSRSRWKPLEAPEQWLLQPDKWETKLDGQHSEWLALQLEKSWNTTASWIPHKSAQTVQAQHE